MYTKTLVGLLIVALLISAPALAQDDEKPTIAMMIYGANVGPSLSIKGAFDVLQAYGYVNEEERAELDAGMDLFGEKMNVPLAQRRI